MRFFFVLLLSISFTFLLAIKKSIKNHQSCENPFPGFFLNDSSLEKEIDKDKVIVIDLHGILASARVSKFVRAAFKEFLKAPIKNYKFLRSFWKVTHSRWSRCLENTFYLFVEKHPQYQKYLDIYCKIANANTIVDKKMLHFIKKLKNKGYKLYLCSNIAEATLKEALDGCIESGNKYLAYLISLFDGYIIAYIDPETKNNIAKPTTEFFDHMLSCFRFQGINIEDVIVIDDYQNNINEMNKRKIPNYFFKNVEKCEEYFRLQGLL